ncbi:head-tail connector protein [Thermomonas sp.]
MDLVTVKQQLDVTRTDQDALLQGYIDAAKVHIEQHCDRTIVTAAPVDDSQMLATPDVEQALLMIVAHWYENREAVATGTIATVIPIGVERLLWYRKRF